MTNYSVVANVNGQEDKRTHREPCNEADGGKETMPSVSRACLTDRFGNEEGWTKTKEGSATNQLGVNRPIVDSHGSSKQAQNSNTRGAAKIRMKWRGFTKRRTVQSKRKNLIQLRFGGSGKPLISPKA